MKVSVIVPVYNVEHYLEECLDSILQQSFSDYEIICVESCSTDGSAEILKKYETIYPNIKVIWEQYRSGLSCARNIGLDSAEGEYVLFVDSDDYLEQDALKKLYSVAVRDGYDIVYFNKRVVCEADWEGTESEAQQFSCPVEKVLTGREMFVHFMQQDCSKSMNAYTQFFLRKFLKENELRFYDGLLHEDYLFFFQCAMCAKRTFDLNEVLYVYRKRKGSLTTYILERHKQSIFYVFLKIFYYWKSTELNAEESDAVLIFLEKVYRKCIQYKAAVQYRGVLGFGDAADNFLYERIMNTEYVELLQEEWQQIRSAKKVWIYGAGKVARETALLFEQEQIEVAGIVVSEKSKMHFMGWNIQQIDEIDFDVNDVVVIAIANKIDAKDVTEKLVRIGVKKIFTARKF